MPNYPVLSPLRHNGKPYAVGETVTMAEKSAAKLILLGALGLALPDEPLTPPEDLATKSGGKKSGAAKGNTSAEDTPVATATDAPASDTATAGTPPEATPPAPAPEAAK